MRRLTIVYLILLISVAVNAQKPELRRVCPNGNDNTLYWNNPTFPCANFKFLIVWERKGNAGPFIPVDTVYAEGQNNYTHKDATPPLSEPNSVYIIERRDSCSIPYNHFSDTISVDIIPPATSELDSVSVDITTNRVVLGWRKNTSADFDKYLLYVFINGFFNAMNPSETRDTFAVDLGGNNPSLGSQSYNINTRDSCGKVPAFEKKHSTIFLENTFDTCLKTYQLKWSHYFGWNKILKYYIFSEIDGGGYILIDSVSGVENTYNGTFQLGKTYNLFIRAIKDTNILVSSSSNKISFATRKRKDPTNLSINYVSHNTPGEDIVLSFNTETDNEVKEYILDVIRSNGTLYQSIKLNSSQIDQEINLGITNIEVFRFVIRSIDICNKISYISDTSNNIILAKGGDFTKRELTWNPYFTWNNGVEKYIIYRGSGSYNNILFQTWKDELNLASVDSEAVTEVGSIGICYYVEARKAGSVATKSKSNMICYPADLEVYIPNAFTPDGLNSNFRPEGLSIDYEKSTLQLFNRWGELVYENPIMNGWDGKERGGQPCPPGVYYYQINIISTKDEKVTKKGFVTLLR